MPLLSRRGFLAATAVTFSAAPLRAQPPKNAATSDAKVIELLEPLLKKHDLPALGAAVVSSNGLKAAGVVGVRKRGDATPATLADKFHIGSDTKAMTATMIGKLVEEQTLRWDTTIGLRFPNLEKELPAELRAVQMEQLLCHRSGLPADFESLWAWQGFAQAGAPRQQRIAVLKKAAKEKLSPVGDKMVYSNMNYVIAAAMAEEATGKPWEELMRDKLFAPLGITTWGFGPMGKPDTVEQPWPHHADGRPQAPVPQADNVVAMGPAGRVHLSLPDWALFASDQLKGARGEPGYLAKATYEKLHASPTERPFYTVGGWAGQAKPELVLGHDGCNTMNYASAVLIPSKNIGVLVVTNQGTVDGPGANGCHAARKALLKEFAGA